MDAFVIFTVDTARKGGAGELLAATSPIDAASGNGGGDWSVPKSVAWEAEFEDSVPYVSSHRNYFFTFNFFFFFLENQGRIYWPQQKYTWDNETRKGIDATEYFRLGCFI